VGSAIDAKASDPIDGYITELFGKKRGLAEELRILIGEAGQAPADGVEALPNLRRAMKRVMVDSIATNWADLAERFRALTANQRTISDAPSAKGVATVARLSTRSVCDR
jgi:hypothetical protein